MTTLYLTLILLLLFVILPLVAFFLYLYWWSIQRSNPQLDGTLTIPGFTAPVEILRDKYGIPHIYAQNRADLFRAQGFIHAQDRRWQMEQNRRIARGTLAEVYGEAALEADRFSRTVGFWRAAEAELATLDAETRQVLDWYAEGVNAYVTARPRRFGAEFNLLRIQPEPWTALDTLGYTKVIGWTLSHNWDAELTRLRLFSQLGDVAAAELEPNTPAANPAVMEGVGSERLMRLQQTAGLLLNQYDQLKSWLGAAAEGVGSNAWVLAPKASLNRRPLLCNDPHLAVQIPGIWYELHLSAPDFEVSGVSFTGTPGVMIGHNADIAWGITNGMVDVQDLYIERPHPDDPTLFAQEDEWATATVIEEVINVRRSQPHVEQVVITAHGPLITGLLKGAGSRKQTSDPAAVVPLALRWTGHEPGQNVQAILQLNQARNWTEFSDALADWATPPQNVLYADDHGNIGYRLVGKVPKRAQNLGIVPAPGWDSNFSWHDYIAYDELPQLYNPPSGKIVSTNNKIVGDDYPYFLGVEFAPGWRAARLETMINKKERLTIRDMEEMQLDTHSNYAEALTPWITLLNSEEPWEKAALDALRKWNYRMEPESEAALVFHYTVIELLELVFGDKLGETKLGYFGAGRSALFLANGFLWRAEARLLELLNDFEHSYWYVDAKSGRQRTREELLQEALASAVKKIRETVGDSMRRWDWGRAHQVRYVHPLGSARLLKNTFNRGPLPVGGDATTINFARHIPQLPLGMVQVTASYRQIFEVGSWDRAQSILNVGQSGHPLSDHYDDQIMMWKEGNYHPMPWSREAVEKAAVYRLRVEPMG